MCLRKSRVTWPVSTQVSRLLPDPHSRLCAMNVAHLDLIINQRGSENFYRVSLLFGNVYMYKQGGVTYSIYKLIFSFSGIECPQGYLGDITGGNIRTGIVSLFWAQAWDNQPYRELALIWEMFADCLIRSSNSELLGFPGGSVVMNPPASAGDAGTQVQSLGQEDPPEEEMATHSSILAWGIPWTEEPGGLQSVESQKSQTRLNTQEHVILSFRGNQDLCRLEVI